MHYFEQIIFQIVNFWIEARRHNIRFDMHNATPENAISEISFVFKLSNPVSKYSLFNLHLNRFLFLFKRIKIDFWFKKKINSSRSR